MYTKKIVIVNSTGHDLHMRAFCNSRCDFHMEKTDNHADVYCVIESSN